jgi:hypothetical protein
LVKLSQGERIVENPHVERLKHSCLVIKEMAEHSRSMSIGAKILIEKHCKSMLKELELIELELMARK